ncbi:MAG TPA: hypothetical protein VEZ48_09900 [Sphingomonadaceae bacterium]|nr:hypothetical protein [Sphingomonadaceae bacterium]
MKDVGAGRELGIHWGTFRLTNEARDAPRTALRAALAKQFISQAQFQAAEPGLVYDLEQS